MLRGGVVGRWLVIAAVMRRTGEVWKSDVVAAMHCGAGNYAPWASVSGELGNDAAPKTSFQAGAEAG